MARYITITSDKSRGIAIFLCLLGFLGLAGLHRFYVGKIITGLIWLLTAGFCGFGTLLDLIRLLIGCFRDNTGTPLRR